MSTTPGLAKSVAMLNRHPYFGGRLLLGTRFDNWVKVLRELHSAMTTSGTALSLVNELRTKCNTGGDIFALLNAIRAEIITNGQLQQRLQDLEDKAYNQILTDPGLQQDAGVATNFENAAQIDGIVNGSYVANIVAAGALNATPTAGWNTLAGQTKIVTLAVTAGGVLSQTVSAVGATIAPRPPSGEMPIGIANVPALFTAGATQIAAGGVTFVDGFPRRLAVHTPIATAAVSAVSAAAMAALSNSTPELLPDVDV